MAEYLIPTSGKTFEFDRIIKIAAGPDYVLALKEDGKVYAWGSNSYYKLGTNTLSAANRPVEIKNMQGITAIAAGSNHALALGEDRKV